MTTNGEWTQLEFDFTPPALPPAEPELCESCDTDVDTGCDCHECDSCGRLVSETYDGVCQGCEDGQTINGLRFQ